MNRVLQLVLLGSHVAAQSATGGNNGTATTTSAISIKTSLELSVDGELHLVQHTSWYMNADYGLDLWDIAIGPVSTANITTTVAATPVPASSLVPPPFLASYSFPPGQQVAEVVTNSSWSFPKDFQLGVAGAAFQVEGAAKDEGRGPSVWDKLVCFSLHGCVVDQGLG